MGGPLPDRLLGLLEGSPPGRQLLLARPEIEAALTAEDYPAFVAHLTVRRRALPRELLARVAEEMAADAAAAAAAAAAAKGRGGGAGVKGDGPTGIAPAYLDLLRAAAEAAGGCGAMCIACLGG